MSDGAILSSVKRPRKKKPPAPPPTCEVCHRVIERGEPTVIRPIWSQAKGCYRVGMSYEEAKHFARHRPKRFFHEACFDREWRYGDLDDGDE